MTIPPQTKPIAPRKGTVAMTSVRLGFVRKSFVKSMKKKAATVTKLMDTLAMRNAVSPLADWKNSQSEMA